MNTSSFAFLLLFLGLTLTVSCKGPGGLVEERRELIERRSSQVTAIANALSEHAPESDGALSLPAGLDFSPSGNAVLMFAEELDDLCTPRDLLWTDGDRQPGDNHFFVGVGTTDLWVRQSACYVRQGDFSGGYAPTETSLRSSIDWVERTQTIAVVRIQRSTPPRFVLPDPGQGRVEQFVPGAILADVLVFDLESGRYLDGAAVRATNTGSIEVTAGDGSRGPIDGDLVEQFGRAVQQLFRNAGATAPRG
jgi:hypothetical protein